MLIRVPPNPPLPPIWPLAPHLLKIELNYLPYPKVSPIPFPWSHQHMGSPTPWLLSKWYGPSRDRKVFLTRAPQTLRPTPHPPPLILGTPPRGPSAVPGWGGGGVGGVPQGPPSSHAAGSHQQPLREDEGCIRAPGGRGAQEWRGTPSMVGSQEQRFLGAGAARHTGKERPGHCGADSTKPPAACYASPRRPPIPGRPGAVTGTQTGPPLRKASDVGLHVAQLRTPRKEAVSERTSPDSPSRLPGSGAVLLNGSGKAGGEGAVAA